MRSNHSLKLTRYGRLCKPGLWHTVHDHSLWLTHPTSAVGRLSSKVERLLQQLSDDRSWPGDDIACFALTGCSRRKPAPHTG